MRATRLLLLMFPVVIVQSDLECQAGTPGKTQAKDSVRADSGHAPLEGRLSIFAGWSWYRMRAFNAQAVSEQNDRITSGIGAELDYSLPIKLASIPFVSDVVLPSLGVELDEASADTRHTEGSGTSAKTANVKWQVRTFGIFFAPALSITKDRLVIRIRPVGAGPFFLGPWLHDGLTIDDRRGRLEISSWRLGLLSALDIETTGKIRFSIGARFRSLKFDDVTTTPKDGWSAVAGGGPAFASSLAPSLDYSGWSLRFGASVPINH